MRRVGHWLLVLALACTPAPASDDEHASNSVSEASSSSEGASTSESSDASASDATTLLESESGPPPDLAPLDCDPIAQDCPPDFKCVPYQQGETWDANKCVPVRGELPAGAACRSAGPSVATDDCDASSMCWEGMCVPFCSGSARSPSCPTSHVCTIAYAGVVAYCEPTCDPLVQDCPAGEGCFWVGDQFVCMSAAACQPQGQQCSFIADCCETQICMAAARVPGCATPFCCADLCDLDRPTCPPGSSCVPFFGGGAPPSYEDVGVCSLP